MCLDPCETQDLESFDMRTKQFAELMSYDFEIICMLYAINGKKAFELLVLILGTIIPDTR